MSWLISNDINLDFVIPITLIHELPSSFEICDSDEDNNIVNTNKFESKLKKKKSANIKHASFSSLKCAFCDISFTQKKNMQRHIKNKHKSIDEAQAYLQSGNSLCLQCGFQCRQIEGLRKHLSAVHFITFQKEKLSFANVKGSASFYLKYVLLKYSS
jgi:hypothetical protein